MSMDKEAAERLSNLKAHLDAHELESKGFFDHLKVTDPATGRSLTVVVCPYEEDRGERWFFAVKDDPVGSPISHFKEASTAALKIKRLLADPQPPADVSAALSGNGLAAPLIEALAEADSIAQTIARQNGYLSAEVIHAAIASLPTDDLVRLTNTAALVAAAANASLAKRSDR